MAETISAAPLAEMRGIYKSFPGVQAADNLSLTLRPGEVLALLGENGAGKSTLMNILAGLYRPDSGKIFIKGREAQINAPRDAAALGIGMVHQNFMLVDSMTVCENVVLGLRGLPFVPDMKSIRAEILGLAERYNLHVNPDAFIWQLSVGEQQRVEIIKLLYRRADILILDEPTAVLTPQESRELGAVIRTMKAEGKGAVFITHKMDEIDAFSDRVMVLRKGRLVAEKNTADTNPSELARLMIGRQLAACAEKKPFDPGRTLLELSELCALNDRGLPALDKLSLCVRSGEILGIAGVAGNGQRELAEVVTGLRPLSSGSVKLDGSQATNMNSLFMIRHGVGHIPQDRKSVGSVGDMSVASNLAMKDYRRSPIALGPIMRLSRIFELAGRKIREFRIDTPSPATPAKFLSGGNVQKIILAREIGACVKLLVAVYPSRGLDVGATEAVRAQLVAQRDAGQGVLLISEDLDELVQVADTIAVLFEGRVMGSFPACEADPEKLGLLMSGKKIKELP